MQPSIRIHLLGSVRVESDRPHGSQLSRTLRGLLGFLAVYRRRTHPRDVLLGLFWGDQPEPRARHCLSTAIWRLRHILEPNAEQRGSLLISDPDGAIGLRLGPTVWLDLEDFEHAASRLAKAGPSITDLAELDALDAALQAPVGELLEGVYDEWALEARERCRSLYLTALVALCRGYRRLGAPERAVRTAETVLTLDPFREDVLRELMRAAVELGNRGLALRWYGDVQRRLRTELHIDPVAETTTLYRAISGTAACTRTDPDFPESPRESLVSRDRTIRELRFVRRRLTSLIRYLQDSGRNTS